MKKLLLAALLVLSLGVVPIVSVSAQTIQPTGQSTVQTRNPQGQSPQQLGAGTSLLQGTTEQQVLGASINQLTSNRAKLVVASSIRSTSAEFYDDPLNSPPQQPTSSKPSDGTILVVAAGSLTALLGLLAIYLASKRRMIDW